MNIKITDNPVELGKVSAAAAVEGIINAIKEIRTIKESQQSNQIYGL